MTLSGAALGFLAEVFLYREVSFFCSKNETKPACPALGAQIWHRGRDQHGRGFIFLTRSKTSQEENFTLFFNNLEP